jgi:hypothetical protein
MRASIASMAAATTLLQPKEAVSIEQADRESATGDTEDFSDSSDLIVNEAEGCNGYDQVEARICMRKGTCITNLVECPSPVAAARILHPLRVDVDTRDPPINRAGKCISKVARATANIEQRFSWARLYLLENQRDLALPDLLAARSLIPPIIESCIH